MRGRVLGREFELDVVRQLASGARKPAQACRGYGVAESLLLRWRKVSDGLPRVSTYTVWKVLRDGDWSWQ